METNFFYDKSEVIKKNRLKKKAACKHKLVKDMIDITPDKSETIVYCVKCEKTF